MTIAKQLQPSLSVWIYVILPAHFSLIVVLNFLMGMDVDPPLLLSVGHA